MANNVQYARGSQAWGICQRCGLRALLNELIFDRYYPGLRVHAECYDDRHPQEHLKPVSDPVALWKPSPEQGGLTPILDYDIDLSGVTLTWTEADTLGAPRIESYAVYRAAGAAQLALIATLVVVYSELFRPPVVTLTYLDDSVDPDVTYTYRVSAIDSYGRQLASNAVTLTTGIDLLGLILTEDGLPITTEIVECIQQE